MSVTNPREGARISRPTWFATSPYGRSAWGPMRGTRDDKALMHAKQLGTELSACGQNALTWVKYWQEFGVGPSDNACAECRRVVVGGSS